MGRMNEEDSLFTYHLATRIYATHASEDARDYFKIAKYLAKKAQQEATLVGAAIPLELGYQISLNNPQFLKDIRDSLTNYQEI